MSWSCVQDFSRSAAAFPSLNELSVLMSFLYGILQYILRLASLMLPTNGTAFESDVATPAVPSPAYSDTMKFLMYKMSSISVLKCHIAVPLIRPVDTAV